jgi:hypothetical protein
MSLPFHLAELVQKIQGDISARKANLLRAQGLYERFLKLLDSYDALSKSDARLLEAYLEDRNGFSTASTKDAAARRDAKIKRFKEEKELKRKLEVCSFPFSCNGNQDVNVTWQYLRQNPKLAEQDDQVVRELHLTNLTFLVHQTFASLESIAQELNIISLAPPPAPPAGHQAGNAPGGPDTRQGAREGSSSNRDGYSDRLDTQLPGLRYTGPILDASGKPLRPFTLTSTRQTLKKGVFRPDHNLPTMSIDEYLEEERKRGGIIEGGGEASGIRPEVDEDDLEKADEETMKARAWDEFKEENPKGAGNTINRG